MRVLRQIVSKFYLYFLWLFFAFLLCGQIFVRLGDAPAARKVTLFADVPSMRDAALAAELERELPEGIRVVKVHPFSYAMMDDKELSRSDLYIVPESRAEQYADSFRPITGLPFSDEGSYFRGGELWGLKVWDAAKGEGIATDYIDYPDEDCWLFFNASSVHIRCLSGTGDDAAVEIARKLLDMTGGT
jgi:hypothetical protein